MYLRGTQERGPDFRGLVPSALITNDSGSALAAATDSADVMMVTESVDFLNVTIDSLNATVVTEFYRHSVAMTAIYCVAYLIVFAVGLVGNCLVIAVVYRSPRMRTVTNFFIVNLAVADILVIVFLPATLVANIFVRKFVI